MNRTNRVEPEGGGKRRRGKKGQTQTTMIHGVNDCTSQQLQMLVSLVTHLLPFSTEGMVRTAPGQFGGESEALKIDPSTAHSFQGTLVDISARITDIVKDDDRWTIRSPKAAENEITAGVKAQRKLLEEQLEMSRRPCAIFQPKLGYNPEKKCWVAILDNEGSAMIPVYGYGATPDEAMKSFDETFVGLQPHIEQRAKETLEQLEREEKAAKAQGKGGLMLPPAIREAMERLHKTAQEADEERKSSKEKPDGNEEKQ